MENCEWAWPTLGGLEVKVIISNYFGNDIFVILNPVR